MGNVSIIEDDARIGVDGGLSLPPISAGGTDFS
jgi:hypothetical protein